MPRATTLNDLRVFCSESDGNPILAHFEEGALVVTRDKMSA